MIYIGNTIFTVSKNNLMIEFIVIKWCIKGLTQTGISIVNPRIICLIIVKLAVLFSFSEGGVSLSILWGLYDIFSANSMNAFLSFIESIKDNAAVSNPMAPAGAKSNSTFL